MKIVALMPVKNEGWILPTTLPQMKRCVDHIVALDGQSQDDTRVILRAHGVETLDQPQGPVNYSAWRQMLLERGRALGGTHFVWLDADEAFTTNFLAHLRERASAMRPGEKLILDWLCLWKNAHHLRTDDSVLSSLRKDFVFCDDGKSGFGTALVHEGRTPTAAVETAPIRISRKEGAVLHFQSVPFSHFQVKQAFMRCREWVMRTAEAWQINDKYGFTLDDPAARCEAVPESWIEGLQGLSDLSRAQPPYYLRGIQNYFDQYGPLYFEPLEIWHVPELYALFTQEVRRPPQSALRPGWWTRTLVRARRKAGRLWTVSTGRSR